MRLDIVPHGRNGDLELEHARGDITSCYHPVMLEDPDVTLEGL